MPDKVTDALASPADDASRFEALEQLLHSPEHRSAFEDFIEEAIRRESGEVAAKMLARTRFFAELVEREGQKLQGAGQFDAIQILEQEVGSILDAASRALAHEDEGELLLPFAKYLVDFLETTGRWREALSLYERIVERASASAESALYAQALISYGVLLFGLSKLDEAKNALSKAKIISEESGDIIRTASAASILGNVTCELGDYSRAIALQEESLRLRRQLGKPHLISASLANLATVYCQLNQAENAVQLFQESLEIDRETGDQRGRAITLNNLGGLKQQLGKFDEAHKCQAESQAIFRSVGDRHGLAMTTGNIGNTEYFRRNFASARKNAEEALALNREIGDDHGIAISLRNLGSIALSEGLFELGGRFLDQSLHLHKKIGRKSAIADVHSLLALAELKQEQPDAAWQRLHEAIRIWQDVGEHNQICRPLIVVSSYLVKASWVEAAAIILLGYQRHADSLGCALSPIEQDCVKQVLGQLSSSIPALKLDQLKAQGVSLTFQELVDYALKALEELKPELVDTAADIETAQESTDS